MRRAVTGLLAALMALLGALPASAASGAPPAAADQGHIGIRLLDAPVSRKDDPRALSYIVDHLQPGTTIRRRIEVANSTDATARISVYAAAARVGAGTFAFDDGRASNELTSWTTMSRETVDVPAGERTVVDVQIAVPQDAAGGERYGVIWAEHASAASDGGVAGVSRVGIRMYLSVGGPAEPASDFRVDSLTVRRLADGTPVVEALVHNTGQRALDMSGDMQLSSGPGGMSAGPFPATLGATLGVGETAPVTVQLDHALPAGPWVAMVTLRSGRLERAVAGEIVFPDQAGATGPSVPVQEVALAEDPRVVVPVAVALVVLVLLGLLSFSLRGRFSLEGRGRSAADVRSVADVEHDGDVRLLETAAR